MNPEDAITIDESHDWQDDPFEKAYHRYNQAIEAAISRMWAASSGLTAWDAASAAAVRECRKTQEQAKLNLDAELSRIGGNR